jgi:hypothetical protein
VNGSVWGFSMIRFTTAATLAMLVMAGAVQAQTSNYCREHRQENVCVQTDGRYEPDADSGPAVQPPPTPPKQVQPSPPPGEPQPPPRYRPPPPPDDSQTQPRYRRPPPPPDDYQQTPRYRRPPPPPVYDNGDDYCFDVGQNLRRLGYRQIRPIDCEGRYFVYRARSGSRLYELRVRSRTGRIVDRVRLR